MTGDVAVAGEVLDGAPTDLVPAGTPDRVADLVRQWLIAHGGRSEHTFIAYQARIRAWLTWCGQRGIDPLAASRSDVDEWHRLAAQIPTQRGTPPSKATLAQWVSVVASWYRFLVDEDVIDTFPVRSRTRPKAPRDSSPVGLSAAQAAALQDRLQHESVLDRAILTTLLWQGLRISELLNLTVRDALSHNNGVATMLVHGKGDHLREISVAPEVAAAVAELIRHRFGDTGPDEVLQQRGTMLLFITTAGARPTKQSVTRTLKRVARAAGIPSHARLSPHSMRHTCATLLLDGGAPLHAVQGFLGHRSPETTGRYDRSRGALARSVAAQAGMRNLLTTTQPHPPGGP